MPTNQYSSEERNWLLKIARQTLVEYLETKKVYQPREEEIPAKLKEKKGVFVTLTENGVLRGCIGYLESVLPIYQSVIRNAINAAVADPRFFPVAAAELASLTIEISILTSPQELKFKDHQELLNQLAPKRAGVIIKLGQRSATYLPQVWSDFKTPQEFLGSLCNKAGLEQNCWQVAEIQIFTYQAEVFKEVI